MNTRRQICFFLSERRSLTPEKKAYFGEVDQIEPMAVILRGIWIYFFWVVLVTIARVVSKK